MQEMFNVKLKKIKAKNKALEEQISRNKNEQLEEQSKDEKINVLTELVVKLSNQVSEIATNITSG